MKVKIIILTFLVIIAAIIYSYYSPKSDDKILKENVSKELKKIKQNRTAFSIDSLQKSLESDTSFGVTFVLYDKKDSSLSIGITPKFDVRDTTKAVEEYSDFITHHKLYYGDNISMIWFIDSRVDDPKNINIKILWGIKPESIFEE